MSQRSPTPRSLVWCAPRSLGALATLSALSFQACHETSNPQEHYRRGSAAAGGVAASGGKNDSNGGSRDAQRGGARAAAGNSNAALGGSADSLGAGGVANEGGSAPPSSGGSPPLEGGSDNAGGAGQEPVDACGAPPVRDEAFTRAALREAAVECASWQFCRFQSAAATLRDALVEADVVTENAAAQQAFLRAFAVWSELELFQFGPLASKAESAGKDSYQGLGIRELVYAWPATARCRVDEQLVNPVYAERGFANVPISGRGLFALEYLLFYTGTDTACAAQSSTAQAWPSDGEALAQHKTRYARALADDVLQKADELVRAYGEAGDFRRAFVSASGYPDDQEALTVLAWALIYAEREVKDWKLGVPLGVTLSHPVSNPETPFALRGTSAIRGNLLGFRRLLQGCGDDGSGIGFDDWLRAAGHAELAEALSDAWQNAMRAAEATPELDRASNAELDHLYRELKALTDLLKSDLFGAGSPLNLKLPAGVASDTD